MWLKQKKDPSATTNEHYQSGFQVSILLGLNNISSGVNLQTSLG